MVGHQHAEHEVVDEGDEHATSLKMTLTDIDSTSLQINMVIPYIFESRLRVKENAWKCVNHTADYGNRCGRYYKVISRSTSNVFAGTNSGKPQEIIS